MMANPEEFITALKGYNVDYPADQNARNAAKLINENREAMTIDNMRKKSAAVAGLFQWAYYVLVLKGLIQELEPV